MKRPYLNKAGFNKLAQSIKDYVNRKITGYDKLGTASTKDFTTYVSPTQTEQLPISSSVYSAMTNMLRGAYHPAGSKTVAELTSDLLVKANLGNVYKITEDGSTSDLFIGGAGQTIKTGDNAIVLYASEDTYKFSLESGVVDLDAYQKKELTSGALIEDVIPSDASASNNLVAQSDLNMFLDYSITDCDTAFVENKCVIYRTDGFCANKPVSNTNTIFIIRSDCRAIGDIYRITQIAETNYSANTSEVYLYIRRGISDTGSSGITWSSWQKLVTEDDLHDRTYFYGPIGTTKADTTNIVQLKAILLPAHKTIVGTMTTNLGGTLSNKSLTLFARTTDITTVDSSEVCVSATNPNVYTQLNCPFAFTNNTNSNITIRLGYYQGDGNYAVQVRAVYNIF